MENVWNNNQNMRIHGQPLSRGHVLLVVDYASPGTFIAAGARSGFTLRGGGGHLVARVAGPGHQETLSMSGSNQGFLQGFLMRQW